MSSIKRAIKFQNLDLKKSIGWFWAVMLIINIISYILNYIYENAFFGVSYEFNNGTETFVSIISVAAANLMPIIIYFIIYCYEMYYQSLPIALSFSVTRKEFYKSVIIDNVLNVFIFALIQSILMKIDLYILNFLGDNPKLDYGIFDTGADNILYMIFALCVCFLAFISLANLLGALNYRFGYKLWIFLWIFFGLIFSLSTTFVGTYIWAMFDTLFTTRIGVLQLIKLGIIILTNYSIGYIIVSNINIKNKVS